MAIKLRNDPISQATLIEYLETKSDFHFELKILKIMKDFGLPCEHGGHYTDPVTKKSREFDIRCRVVAGPFRVQFAVECKNLQVSNPLLVSCVDRSASESYHHIAQISDPPDAARGGFLTVPMHTPRAHGGRISNPNSLYREGEPVGKSTTQVGINANQNAEMVVGDSEVYEKWGQALSSLDDLIQEMEDMRGEGRSSVVSAAAMPILVVPNGTLWRTIYGEDGTRREDPIVVDRVSIFVGQAYGLGLINPSDFLVSHVEVITEQGLVDFIGRSLSNQEAVAASFFAADPDLPDVPWLNRLRDT